MNKQLRVLIIEDSDDDTLLLLRELRSSGYDPAYERVDTAEAMRRALLKGQFDIIISDYLLPDFSGLAALNIFRESGLDLPFIIVSGNIGEEIAVGAMKAGAQDYIMKNRLARLVPVVERELREAVVRRELKKSEAQLKLAQAEKIHMAHLSSIGELAAGIAHEINNPLNGIINYAQLLANKLDKGSWGEEIAKKMIKEGDRIAGIVRSLLLFARQRKEDKKLIHIEGPLFESFALTETLLQKDGIVLEKDVPADLPQIVANPEQLQQVFLNIISNARYAMNQKCPSPNGSKIFRLKVRKMITKDMPYIRIEFCDTGTGIPSDILDKVLNPFYSTKPEGQGTGLGLSISHGIITDHGGNISIDSLEGQYTNVMVDLPLVLPQKY